MLRFNTNDMDLRIDHLVNFTQGILDAFHYRQRHIRPVLTVIARLMYLHFQTVFENEGSDETGPWAPIAVSTLQWKRSHGYPDDLLVATGLYKESLTRRSPYGQLSIRDNTITITSKVEGKDGALLAVYHEEGTARMPARPVINSISATLRERWTQMVAHYIITGDVRE